MNSLTFLTKLANTAKNINKSKKNSDVSNSDRERMIDFFVANVNGNAVGIIKTKSLNYLINDLQINKVGRYKYYAYLVNKNDELKKEGVIVYTAKDNIGNLSDSNGYINRIVVSPYCRGKGIGSYLLKLAEQDIVKGFRFNRVILDRAVYDFENHNQLNKNHLFYDKHKYVMDYERLSDENSEYDATRPMIKFFDSNLDFINIDEIKYIRSTNVYDSLAKKILINIYENSDGLISNACIFRDDSGKPYILLEKQGSKIDKMTVEAYAIKNDKTIYGIGYAEFYMNNTEKPELSNYLTGIAVNEDYRERGIAKKILKYVEGRVFASGAKKIILERDNTDDYQIIGNGEIKETSINKRLYKEYYNDNSRLVHEYSGLEDLAKDNNVADIKKCCPLEITKLKR